jgi:ubiquinone biosynthesis protein COQ9
MTDAPELAAAREKILAATLRHVPFDGWTPAAFAAGIRDADISEAAEKLAFQGGLSELAEYYCRFADERMLAALDPTALDAMKVRERITYVLRLRLEQAAPEREAVRALMGWLALPGNQGLAGKCLYRTVDAMWHGVGDTSTDFNFYSKRAILAGVLGATVLYWLSDDSEEFTATWSFLDRRIDNVMSIEKGKARLKALADELPDPFEILRRIRSGGDHPPKTD